MPSPLRLPCPASHSLQQPLSSPSHGADPAVVVSFPLDGDADGAHLVAWTTTPWTLPSNLALCVNAEFDYVKARDPGESCCVCWACCVRWLLLCCVSTLGLMTSRRGTRVSAGWCACCACCACRARCARCAVIMTRRLLPPCKQQHAGPALTQALTPRPFPLLPLPPPSAFPPPHAATGRVYIVMESRLAEIPGAVPKPKKGGKKGGEEAAPKGFEVGGFEGLGRQVERFSVFAHADFAPVHRSVRRPWLDTASP